MSTDTPWHRKMQAEKDRQALEIAQRISSAIAMLRPAQLGRARDAQALKAVRQP